MKSLRKIFDDRLTQAAGIILVIFISLVIITGFTSFPLSHPLLGVTLFGLAMFMFILGGVVFVLAIVRTEGKRNGR